MSGIPVSLPQRLDGVRGDLAHAHEFKPIHPGGSGKSDHPMHTLSDEVQAPDSFAEQLAGLVREADHHVYRIDGVRARIGPVRPIMLVVHSGQRVYFKTLRHSRFLLSQGRNAEHQQHE